ncbi:Tenascin-X [Camponotus floridanus]|uniref:Tenascin-X n=1 Tax=Camponotus floridanus TaxID=104421 RepID=E1ZZW4_CAMFO|nr:Tenascin-X [Camponotus floridanus]
MKFLYAVFILTILQNELITTVTLFYEDSSEDLYISASEGRCTTLVSYRTSKLLPYSETYKEKTWGIFYKTRTRWNYRTQYYTSWRRQYVCCSGYKLGYKTLSVLPVCQPICEPECGNGICIKPNVCICNYGYEEKHTFSYPVCVPVCTHNCMHGKCTAPDVCTCDHGYSLSINNYTCEPVCDLLCLTGSYCSEPNHCACLDGYTDIIVQQDLRILNKCRPICKNPCIHGECTAPDTCTCHDGYELDSDNIFVCKPICEHGCLYGTCTAPYVCTCDKGYSLKTPSTCEPICSEACIMGICVAPESCSCFEGYGLLENSKHICEPVCEKACINGRCTAPGICTCNEGFQLSGDESMKHACEPYCEISCEPFGMCAAPNVCICFEGYRLINRTQAKKSISYFADNSMCEPICDTECINGFCSAPETCICDIGYQPSGGIFTNICEPICSQNCINGVCSAPEICTCNEGYRPAKNNSSNICEPFCETDCINGYCSAPNECTCNFGYQPIENNRTNLCEPICNPSCKNSICVQPDVCNCKPGYRQSTHSTNVCDPICHPACETNGICEAPDLCVCEDNYRMIYYNEKDVPFKCEPICSVDCGNGTCTAPDRCTCFDGYRNAETGWCEPFCSTCNNGTCVAPEVCECDDGFIFEDSGIRSEGNLSSFSEDELGNASRCVPRCENCDNGDCVAPNECQCHVGFVKIKDICEHACQGGCGSHGECIDERRVCECNYGWTGPHCDEPTLCISILDDEDNRTESLTVTEEQNNTIKHVLVNNPECPECINKINNETLCFKMYTNATEEKTQIGCLMNQGYRASNDTNDEEMCVPVCTNGCINGTCIEPDICSCNKDYWLDSDGFTCRPVCDEECESNNGYCNEPHVCSCLRGYKKTGNNFTSSMCEPVCDRECINGYCRAPNVCKCLDDYEHEDNPFTCSPKCNKTCVFGTCVAPQTCQCDYGYRYRDESTKYICEPICEMDCSNGTCVTPGVCVCDEGFVYDNQMDPVCKPHCTVPCGPHGKCTSPNTCTCSEGYRYSNASFPLKNESLCEPICERGCQNGDCVGPNYCICHNHFVPNFGSSFEVECIPKCSRNCSGHSACIIEDNEHRCKCHYGWTGWDCDQPTLCITTMDFNSSDINRITIRNDTNSTIIQVYENAPYCQCNNFLNKESLCYMIHSDKGNTTPIISCLLSTDLPCYLTSVPHSASIGAAKEWPLVVIAILIATILITVAYLMYRRYEKKKLIIGMPTNFLVRKSVATESLLNEM